MRHLQNIWVKFEENPDGGFQRLLSLKTSRNDNFRPKDGRQTVKNLFFFQNFEQTWESLSYGSSIPNLKKILKAVSEKF